MHWGFILQAIKDVWDPSVIFSDFLKFCFAFYFDGAFLTSTVFNNVITYSNIMH